MAVIVIGRFDLSPEHADSIVAACAPLIEDVRTEPGCLAYDWTIDPFVQGRVHAIERWVDSESLAHHFRLPAFPAMRTLLRSAGPIVASSRKYLVDEGAPVFSPDGTPTDGF